MTTRFAEYLCPPEGTNPRKRFRVLPEVIEGMLLNVSHTDEDRTNPLVEVGLRLADDTVVALSFAQASLIAKLFRDYATIGDGSDKKGRKVYGSMGLVVLEEA